MAERWRSRRLVLTPIARGDIQDVLQWSRKQFGPGAAFRYSALLIQALHHVEIDPLRPGSTARPETMMEGVRTYHLSLSKSRVVGVRVKNPRHFILYRSLGSLIEVNRILHDRRELMRHLPEEYKAE